MRTIVRALLAALALGVLGGCASGPRYAAGLQWVQEQEADRRQLEAQGFPQYTWY